MISVFAGDLFIANTDMDAYSQNFQFAAKSFFVCQYCNFENLYLKLGGETLEDIILIILGGRPCKTAMGLYYPAGESQDVTDKSCSICLKG